MKKYAPLTLLFGFLVLTFGFLWLGQNRPVRDARLLSEAFVAEVERCRLAVEAGTLPDMAGYAPIQRTVDEIFNRYSAHFATLGGRFHYQLTQGNPQKPSLRCAVETRLPEGALSLLELRSLTYEALIYRDDLLSVGTHRQTDLAPFSEQRDATFDARTIVTNPNGCHVITNFWSAEETQSIRAMVYERGGAACTFR